MKRYLLLLILTALYACGGGSSGSSSLPPPTDSSVNGGTGQEIGAASSMTLAANPGSLIIKASSSITATVLDVTNANVPDGTKVRFTLNDSSLGKITSQAATSQGKAIATFTASTTPGTAIITATSGSVSQTISVTIQAAAAASIEYVSATPQVIGLRGTGQTEQSVVIFAVKDVTGGPIADGTAINFTMNGPSGGKLPGNGGEYIGDLDSTPTQAAASTIGGQVTIKLNSGDVSGPVTIIATVAGTSVSTSSSTISIGGGLPSAKHFNLATTKFNLPGLVVSGSTATETAFIADRFGNFDLLTGTSVSFYTEAGAIGRSGQTDATGTTTSTIRTQNPMPADVAPLGTHNSTDGWVTVLATVQGEEAFDDLNGNGVYDIGEPFTDLGEPFIDKNNDGCRNDGTTKNCNGVISPSSDPFEEYIDANGNGKYDGPNGVWDGPNCPGAGCQTSKMIWTDITLAFTGGAASCAFNPLTIGTLASGASTTIFFSVGDINGNALIGGTTITATNQGLTTVTLSPASFDPIPDMVPSGPYTVAITLTNAVCTPDPGPPVVPCNKVLSGSVLVKVTPPDSFVGGCSVTISGSAITK